MSTLFPAVKSFSNGDVDKIFYLTAKNSGVEAAFNATKLLVEKGLRVVAIQITAKEKICACPGSTDINISLLPLADLVLSVALSLISVLLFVLLARFHKLKKHISSPLSAFQINPTVHLKPVTFIIVDNAGKFKFPAYLRRK